MKRWRFTDGSELRFSGISTEYRSCDPPWLLPTPVDAYEMMWRDWKPTLGLSGYIDALWVEFRRTTRGVTIYDELVPW